MPDQRPSSTTARHFRTEAKVDSPSITAAFLSSRRATLVASLAIAAFSYAAVSSFDVDDAAISFAYAENLADGHGLGSLFAGADRVDGYSNFLWVILLAGFSVAGVSVDYAAEMLGVVFTLGAVAVAHAVAWRLVDDKRIVAGTAAVGTSAAFILWSASGLETSLFVLLVLALTLSLLVDQDEDALPWRSALIAFALTLTRPEAWIYAVAAAAFLASRSFRTDSGSGSNLRRTFQFMALFAVPSVVFLAWHNSYFASLLPTPVTAKSGSRAEFIDFLNPTSATYTYLGGYLLKHGAILLVPAVVAGVLGTVRNKAGVVTMMLAASVVLPLVSPDWMQHYRFYAVTGPLAILLGLVAIDRVKDKATLWRTSVAGIVAFSVLNLAIIGAISSRGYEGLISESAMRIRFEPLLAAAIQLGLEDPLYAVPDIGAPARDDRRILDLAGLADTQVAHNLHDTAALEKYVFQERRPDLIRLNQDWNDITKLGQMGSLRSDYLPINSGPADRDEGGQAWVRKSLFIGAFTSGQPVLTTPDGVALQRIDAPEAISPSQPFLIDLTWRATKAQTKTANWQVVLRDSSGRVVSDRTGQIGYGWYPSPAWSTSETVSSHINFGILPNDQYTVDVRTPDSDQIHRQSLSVNANQAFSAANETADAVRNAGTTVQLASAHTNCVTALAAAGELPALVKACDEANVRYRNALAEESLAKLEANDASAVRDTVVTLDNVRGRDGVSSEERELATKVAAAARDTNNKDDAYALWQAAMRADRSNAHNANSLNAARSA